MNFLKMISRSTSCRVFFLFFVFSVSSLAQTNVGRPSSKQSLSELRTARSFEAARANPLDLRAFLVRMPKGADLHNHLSGAVYSESWIRAAREDSLCVDLATLSFRPAASPAAEAPAAVDPSTAAPATCGEGRVPAAQAYADQHL